MNMSKIPTMKVLMLLDAYCQYHEEGSESLRTTYWNLTKARCRNAGSSAQTALILNSSSSASNDMTTNAILSLMNSSNNNENENENRSDRNEIIVLTRSMVLLKPRLPLPTTATASTDSTGLEAEQRTAKSTSTTPSTGIDESQIRYTMFDPIRYEEEEEMKRKLNQQEQKLESCTLQQNLQVQDTEGAGDGMEDYRMGDLIAENVTDNEKQYMNDPTQATGLRQRKQQSSNSKPLSTTSVSNRQNDPTDDYLDEKKKSNSVHSNPYKKKQDGSDDEKEDNDQLPTGKKDWNSVSKGSTTSTKSDTSSMRNAENSDGMESKRMVTIVDPFDLGMLMINCSSSHRNEIKLAQQNAIRSLQQYIHAATLVASIQTIIASSSKTVTKTSSVLPVTEESEQ